MRFFTTIALRVASDIKTCAELEAPLPSTQNPFQLVSLGEVEVTWTAKRVVGFAAGLPFAAFVKLRVEVVAPESVGAPGLFAAV